MKKKEHKMRKHVYLRISTVKYLITQARKNNASLGDVIDYLVEVHRGS